MYQSAILTVLPAPVASVLERTNLLSPLNLSLTLLLLSLLLSLVPSTPYAPSPSDLPSSPHAAYNWRPAVHPARESQKWGRWTPQELRAFDGTGEGGKGKVLIAVRRKVYDVSSGRNFYGPGGPYSTFAGRDASRGLSKQSFEPDMLTPVDAPIDPLEDLVESEWAGLRDWESHFQGKYPQVGDLVQSH
ncbi:hypothetical protein JCM8097_004754 [Rhodosporidiobolus ruineniae]